MNILVKAVLVCAFLTNSLIQETTAEAAENSVFAVPLHQLTKRAATPQVTCGCTNSSIPNVKVNLTIFTNIDADLYSAADLLANVSYILSINESLVALINGKNGSAVVINITASTGVYLPNGTWTALNQSYEDYLSSLTTGLAPLLNRTGAVSFKVATASSTILNAVNQVVIRLVSYIKLQIQLNPKYGLQLIINLSKQYLELFTSFDLEILGSGALITVDLAAELIILNTFEDILSLIPGALDTLLTTPESLKEKRLIASQTSGLGRFVIIFKLIANLNDTGIIEDLNSTLSNIEPLFKTLNGLGGNINTGLAGLIKVLANLVTYLKGNASLEVVIQVLIQFLAYNSPAERQAIPATLDQNLTTLLDDIEAANATVILAGLVDIVNGLLNKTLVVDGVNISAIITLLTGNRNALEILVAVLLQLRPVASSSVTLPTCLLVLIVNLNNPIGVQLLRGLGIIIKVAAQALSLGNIIGSLLGSVGNLIFILLGNLYGALVSLPVIGFIVLALQGAISVITGGALNLRSLISANVSVQGLLKGVLQVCGGVKLGVGSSILTQVQGLLSLVASISVSLVIQL